MGREVRRVPANWQHPKDERGHYIPLLDGSYWAKAREWRESEAAWRRGEVPEYATEKDLEMPYSKWAGSHPDESDYRPDWPDELRTHYQMYETVSEGTPLSPVFATPEELARWCADNGADAGCGATATYEQWLRVARGGYAPSMVMHVRSDGSSTMVSGVEALSDG